MPDLYMPSTPVTMETGDGFLVISKALRTGSVIPPYQYQYGHEHFRAQSDAQDYYNELERGEMRHWSPVAIVACKGGVPLGCKKVL